MRVCQVCTIGRLEEITGIGEKPGRKIYQCTFCRFVEFVDDNAYADWFYVYCQDTVGRYLPPGKRRSGRIKNKLWGNKKSSPREKDYYEV